ncbi:MAG: thermonuclease family protein [Nitrosopumilaceae archaeon]|nr:thermonuclease family protein [Nitrosopumilaceae archaeon]
MGRFAKRLAGVVVGSMAFAFVFGVATMYPIPWLMPEPIQNAVSNMMGDENAQESISRIQDGVAVLPGPPPEPAPGATPASPVQPIPRDIPWQTAVAGTVSRVIDGDTIHVNDDVRIRLALVNTPERGEHGYAGATSFTRSACPAGTTIIYDLDDGQRHGSYGRVIALVWCSGYGSEPATAPLNELLLANGHASIDRRFCTSSEFGGDAWAQRGGC